VTWKCLHWEYVYACVVGFTYSNSPSNHLFTFLPEFTNLTTNAIMLDDLVWANSQPEVFYNLKKKW